MSNGGGGTLVYGIDEAEGDWPTATSITPTSDRGLVVRLEDVVRDGVRPPLLFDLSVINLHGGYVLAADVQPSPLGPYMVIARGNYRYHRRIGRSTEPMDEQQVRDAYALALRGREHRAALWQSHALPMAAPTDDPWLIVSALPEEPLSDLLDLGAVEPGDICPPPESRSMSSSLNSLVPSSVSDGGPMGSSVTTVKPNQPRREHPHSPRRRRRARAAPAQPGLRPCSLRAY